MRNSFLLIFAVVFIAACSNKNKVPKGILPKAEMQEVMWDLLRAGEFLDGYVFRDSAVHRSARAEEWNDKVYQLHHTTKEAFEKSYSFYKEHPAMMKEIMDSLSKKHYVPSYPTTPTVAHRDTTPIKESLITKKSFLPSRGEPGSFLDSLRKARLKQMPKLK